MEDSELPKVIEDKNKREAQKPEARTSCLKDGDMPRESAVRRVEQSCLCPCLEPQALLDFRLDQKLAENQGGPGFNHQHWGKKVKENIFSSYSWQG
jgi:hypothetical protein